MFGTVVFARRLSGHPSRRTKVSRRLRDQQIGRYCWGRYGLVALTLVLTGCVTTDAGHRQDNVTYLQRFPGYQEAGKAAPGWVIEAMMIIDELERELRQIR